MGQVPCNCRIIIYIICSDCFTKRLTADFGKNDIKYFWISQTVVLYAVIAKDIPVIVLSWDNKIGKQRTYILNDLSNVIIYDWWYGHWKKKCLVPLMILYKNQALNLLFVIQRNNQGNINEFLIRAIIIWLASIYHLIII